MALWTVQEIVDATGGVVEGAPDTAITGVSIDSRTLEPGDLFIAIAGDEQDGHKYVAGAFEAGAALALVAKGAKATDVSGGPLVRVEDTLKAMQALGAAARARSGAKIIAVTGSVGKTGTKEALSLALAPSGEAHVSQKSYNNHWGVPLSLARLARSAKFAVFEVGMNHAGEIAPLSRMIRPHLVIVTNVEPVHIGHFPSLDAIADAKAEIFAGLEPDGIAVLNRDNVYFDHLKSAAAGAGGGPVIGFGQAPDAQARLVNASYLDDCSCIDAVILGHEVAFKIGAPGAHLAMNALAVLAAAEAIGADLALAALALSGWTAMTGRGERRVLAGAMGTVTLIDESYNANPASMRAAISGLANATRVRGGRRIAVLGDMLELGKSGPDLHAGLAKTVADAGIDLVFACGPLMRHLFDGLPETMRGAYAKDAKKLEKSLTSALVSGDVVMIKGSLGSRMAPLVDAVADRFSKAGAVGMDDAANAFGDRF